MVMITVMTTVMEKRIADARKIMVMIMVMTMAKRRIVDVEEISTTTNLKIATDPNAVLLLVT